MALVEETGELKHLTVGDLKKAIENIDDSLEIKAIYEGGSYDGHGKPWNDIRIKGNRQEYPGVYFILDPNFEIPIKPSHTER